MKSVYDKQTSATLTRVLAGFERDFDTVSTDPYEAKLRPKPEWYTDRMSTIRNILDKRQSSANCALK